MFDSAQFAGWSRTGFAFPVVAPGFTEPTLSPVCRFYGRPERGLDSHFRSAFPAECADVIAKFSASWIYESANVFSVRLPDVATDNCSLGTLPTSRYFNHRSDVNHRYVFDDGERFWMAGRGWTPEGYGSRAVVMCAPLF